jgi:hypothetical protein
MMVRHQAIVKNNVSSKIMVIRIFMQVCFHRPYLSKDM